MKAVRISGTEHYAEEAPELLKRYESVSFADHHRSVIHLIPPIGSKSSPSASSPEKSFPVSISIRWTLASENLAGSGAGRF